MLQNIIENYINSENNNGLMLLNMPTGFGKTYNVMCAIYDKVSELQDNQKIFFVTTLIKNLPMQELQKIYTKNGRSDDFLREVMEIKSNMDYVLDNLLELQIPTEFQSKQYEELVAVVKQYKAIEKIYTSTMEKIKKQIEVSIRENYEPCFRRYIYKIIKDKMPSGVKARKDEIRRNPMFKWIGELYPTVFTDDYKVFMLSMNKFLVRNTTLIEASYYFVNYKHMENSIVFIDEFDATKATMQGVIIQNALNEKADYIELFIQLYNSLIGHEISRSMLNAYEQYIKDGKESGTDRITLQELREEAKRINNTYLLRLSYKTRREGVYRDKNFLFNDKTYHTILRNNKTYIRISSNVEEGNNVEITFENRDEFLKNHTEKDINIFALLRNIKSFLNKYKFLVLKWAEYFVDFENSHRNQDESEFTLENAMKSIYVEFGLNETNIKLLMSDIYGNGSYIDEDDEDLFTDMAFYNKGFRYYEFRDSDEHLTKTKFQYLQLEKTPEKILVEFCKKAKVLGISATATVSTVLGNYDLNYLKKELDKSFKHIPEADIQKLEEEFRSRIERYKDGTVNVELNIVDRGQSGSSIEDRLNTIFNGDEDMIGKYCRMLAINGEDESYVNGRYCSIFQVMKEFIVNNQIQSLLCMNMPIPKNEKQSFNLKIFSNVFDDLSFLFDTSKTLKSDKSIVVLKSDNFDNDKIELLRKLSDGNKIFVMSSYQTIGAGQNLQYAIPNGKKCITIYEFEDSGEDNTLIKYKDFDAIYLGDITNIVTNLNSDINGSLKEEELLNYLFEVEYLYQNDEISFLTLKKLIRRGFKRYAGEITHEYEQVKKIGKCRSNRLYAAKEVIQATGRICRTFNKNEKVYIFTTEELLARLDTSMINLELLNPETRVVFEAKKQIKQNLSEDEEKILNRAERIALDGKNFIMQMLTGIWTNKSMNLWAGLRDAVLRYPTASEDIFYKNVFVNNFYITNCQVLNSYLFAQSGDFSEVIINFDKDRIAFKAEMDNDYMSISEVTEDESRLKKILLYPGMDEWFRENGWATEFMANKYIMSPILFQNIYKGALGEVAGKFILRKELGIELQDISEPEKFEFFDYILAPNVYVDFKHWKQSYNRDKERTREEIKRKLRTIGGKKAFIINVIGSDNYVIDKDVEGKVVEIPYLLDENTYTVNVETINELRKEVLG